VPVWSKCSNPLSEHGFHSVVVAELDRLTRSVKDLCELLERFERKGVAPVSVAYSESNRPWTPPRGYFEFLCGGCDGLGRSGGGSGVGCWDFASIRFSPCTGITLAFYSIEA
jgi:hypothetical protein